MISLQKYPDESFSLSINDISWFPVGFPWENVWYYGFKYPGITKFMTALFLGTIEWE